MILCVVGMSLRDSIARSDSPPLDASNLDSTNHDANGRYFDKMYASSETRMVGCFIGGLAGVVLKDGRERIAGMGPEEIRRFLVACDFVGSATFLTTLFLLFSDLKTTFDVGQGDVAFIV